MANCSLWARTARLSAEKYTSPSSRTALNNAAIFFCSVVAHLPNQARVDTYRVPPQTANRVAQVCRANGEAPELQARDQLA